MLSRTRFALTRIKVPSITTITSRSFATNDGVNKKNTAHNHVKQQTNSGQNNASQKQQQQQQQPAQQQANKKQATQSNEISAQEKKRQQLIASIEERFESMDKLKEIFGDLVTLDDLAALVAEGVVLEDLSEEELKSMLKRRKVKEASVDLKWHQYFPTRWSELNYVTSTMSASRLQQLEETHVRQQFGLFKEGYEIPLIETFARTQRTREERLQLLRRERNRLRRREERDERREFLSERRKSMASLFLPRNVRVNPLRVGLKDTAALLDDPMKLMDLRDTMQSEVNPHFQSPALWWRHAMVGREELYNRVLQDLGRTKLPLKPAFKAIVDSEQSEEQHTMSSLQEITTAASGDASSKPKRVLEEFLRYAEEEVSGDSGKSLVSIAASDSIKSRRSALTHDDVTDQLPVMFSTVHYPSWPDINDPRSRWLAKQRERKTVMKVKVSALGLPAAVEQRLIALAGLRYADGVLTIPVDESQDKLRNKYFCKQLLREMLSEAWRADDNYVPLDGRIRSTAGLRVDDSTIAQYIPYQQLLNVSRSKQYHIVRFDLNSLGGGQNA